MGKIIKILITLLMINFPLQETLGEKSVNVINYEILDFPNIQSDVLLLKNKYIPETDLKISDFLLRDGTNEIPIISITNYQQQPFPAVSLVLSFDLAVSLSSGEKSGFDIAKYIAKLLSTTVLNGESECAITSFDQYAYLDIELTKDSLRLIEAIERIKPAKSSNFAAGITNFPSGAIAQAVQGKTNRTIILISDNKNQKSQKLLIETLKQQKIRFFCITLGLTTQKELKEICDSTGGYWFDNVNDSSDAELAVNTCLSYVYNYKPSELIWQAEENCNERHYINFSVTKDVLADNIVIDVPQNVLPYIEIEPKYLSFSAIIPGNKKDLEVVLTARNDDIILTEFYFSNTVFSVAKGGPTAENPTVRIDENTSRTITVRFEPLDSALVFDSMNVTSNACFGEKLLITGGFPNTPPRERNLILLSPHCGETLLIGDTASVRWSGLLPNDVIQLEYSLDDGNSWNILAKDINGLKFDWAIPDFITDKCLVRAIQLWPNNVGQTMNFWHSLAVQSANFNSIGDLVVTASKDSTARVWNSNNGFELHYLKGHRAPVRWANFSPDGRFVITASDDSTARVWDISDPEVKFSKEIITLIHSAEVKSANYSPDGKYIVSAGWDGYIKLWDAKTGNFIRDIVRENFKLWFAEFSHDGKYLVTVGNSSKIKIWDTGNWELFKTLTLNNGNVIHANFSPDGKKLLTAGWFGRALMWDLQTGDTLFTVTHPDTSAGINPINSTVFDFSGKYFLTTSIDKSARLWDAETGELVKTLREHRSAVQFATFNFDGSRILTSSWDSTAKIWNLNKRDLQMDSTDCLISIDRASVRAFDIAMGDVLVGQSKNAELDTFLINNSGFKVKVKDIRISGRDSSDFKIMEDIFPYVIDSLKTKPIGITFSPSSEGNKEAEIVLNIPGNKISKSITGRGVLPDLQAEQEFIDFQKVEIGDYKDKDINIIVKNVSQKSIEINSIDITGPDFLQFIIIDSSKIKTLLPGDGYNISLRFIPEAVKRNFARISFNYNGGAQDAVVSLLGEGIKPVIDTATISIESFKGVEGNIYSVPIKVGNFNNKKFMETIAGFTIDLSFNGTMLQPLFDDFTGRVEDGIRILTFDIPSEFNEDSVLKMLKFKVAMGNDTATQLQLSNIKLIGKGKTAITLKPGSFILTGYCKKGGTRLFDSDGDIALMQNRPNPFSNVTTIEFEVFESGITKLYILDMTGRIVKTLVDEILPPGVYSNIIEVPGLSTGTYYYVLQTPTFKISRRMEISR